MDAPATLSVVIAVIGAIVAIATWLTSARKSRVDNLVAIIDAQAKHIDELGKKLDDMQKQLERANLRITQLESENRRYRRKLLDACIDPDEDVPNAS